MARILKPDLCIIGAGAAGLNAAAIAVAVGARVVIIERGRMGGEHLHHGCIPTKTLIDAAGQIEMLQRAPMRAGRQDAGPTVSFEAIRSRIAATIMAVTPNAAAERFAAMGCEVLKGEARFSDHGSLTVGETEVRARRFIIATGSRPVIPAIEGLGDLPYLTSETIFDLVRLPERLIVIGAGATGMELAQAFRGLGSQVVVIDAKSMLCAEDPELVAVVRRAAAASGVSIFESAEIARAERKLDGISVSLREADGAIRQVDGSHILVAAGREPVLDGLGLEAAGVTHESSGIVVDSRMRSSNKRIYAIGDVTTGACLTHLAQHQAGVAVRHALFRQRVDAGATPMPRATFTRPELATVGLAENEARQKFRRIEVLRWPFSEIDRAHCQGRTNGFIKVIADRKGRILGAGIVGELASELISPWTLAIARGLKVQDMAALAIPYPTLSEGSRRAAMAYFMPRLRSPSVRFALTLNRWLG